MNRRHCVFARLYADALCTFQISAGLCVSVRGDFSLGLTFGALFTMWGRTNTPEPMVEAARAVVVALISVVGAQRRKPSRFGCADICRLFVRPHR